jgi:hypothetical protein
MQEDYEDSSEDRLVKVIRYCILKGFFMSTAMIMVLFITVFVGVMLFQEIFWNLN